MSASFATFFHVCLRYFKLYHYYVAFALFSMFCYCIINT